MIDRCNRNITYLRLSVTNKCNFKCIYCMPNDYYSCYKDVVSLDELFTYAEEAVNLGINKIRLTGGEPLIREGIVEFCKDLKRLNGLQELTLTTNGYLLPVYATALKEAGVNRINISLDTLDGDKFKEITGIDAFNRVIKGIESAVEAGFKVKINTVLLGGINDDEINQIAGLTKTLGVDVRFIELMAMGACASWPKERFITSEAIIKKFDMINYDSRDGVSEMYSISGAKGKIGFIRPISNKFCDTCNRIRITADGKLKPCLHSNEEIDLRGLNREILRQVMIEAIQNKPKEHNLDELCFSNSARSMNEIGG